MKALEVYSGSDGDLTKRYYAELAKRGPIGIIALNLMRAQKCSSRAKVYRGGVRGIGSYRAMAYDRKTWSIGILCKALIEHASELGIRFGWKEDPAQHFNPWVLYVELPQGQVSFHCPRLDGPDYSGEWDRKHLSAERILAFCDQVFNAPDPRQMELP